MSAPATRFVMRSRAQLFPAVPLLIGSSDVRAFSDLTLGVKKRRAQRRTIRRSISSAFCRYCPITKTVVVATGGSPTEKFWTDTFWRSFERYSSRLKFEWFTDLSADEMVKRASEPPPQSAIFYGTIRVDARGARQERDILLHRFIEANRAPVSYRIVVGFPAGGGSATGIQRSLKLV